MPIFLLNEDINFPDPSNASEEGLLAIGGDLLPERLLKAYSKGIFPWYSDDEPILWWSPDPRCVLFIDKYRIPRSLKPILRKNLFTVQFDTQFEQVINFCAKLKRKGQSGKTWITPNMIKAYIQLHYLGYAHSVETYYENKLVGGLYGIAIGKVFFGESMFYLLPNASKIAYHCLVQKLKTMKFEIIDNQQTSNHILQFGAQEISRNLFLTILGSAVEKKSKIGKW